MPTVRTLRLCTLGTAIALVAACAESASTPIPAAASAIDALDRSFERWVNSGHLDSIATGYFASDASILQPGAAPVVGTDAIAKLYASYAAMGSLRVKLTRTGFRAADSLAFDIGTYELVIRDRTDSLKVLLKDHGNYVTTFVYRNGQWRGLYDVAVSAVPPAPASPQQR